MAESKPLRFTAPFGPVDPPASNLNAIQMDLLEHSASGIRMRGNATQILQQWKTTRRPRLQSEERKAA
ncbi:MAG: hypothetical protein O7G85_04280 [Planctomycetota bacterium]|nr:hypothetical protein [Planctomycetota bacterium]